MTPRADRMFLCALLLFAMGCQSAHDRRFLACRDRITDGMTKQQVEEIMQGVAVRGSDHEACKRRDSLTQPEHADCWHFEMKHRSVDREDHFIVVFFDLEGRVVGKRNLKWLS